MKLYRISKGSLLQHDNASYLITQPWDELIGRDQLHDYLRQQVRHADLLTPVEADALLNSRLLAPIGAQEVWAAGVTYLRSRDARMEESKESGGATFYDKVYEAERPELFFKSQPHRVAAHDEEVYIRHDSTWNVPEPELTLFISPSGAIQGYTIGNDMSSRSIEGENPLYLPQAKVYQRSAALGPCLYVPAHPLPTTTRISMVIRRGGKDVYAGEVAISQIKRKLSDLAAWLYRDMDFPHGCFLMTGTCLVPGNEFTLEKGDRVEITIDHIGTLSNTVGYKK
ncbi:MAG TPA: fumarylacetoacetate hydrolase family protein [Puia sp.]|uniref:fumarylacetoacetate hydrolase family protein n=1 Tax=Puia sp. TaxID=2045100 RepID=UPI002CF50F9B|nr:fumarylacetoacetate hydrolase family protein [Puia sp.]HVU98247.1 fumarylacetoacetate hydrolase family protein [Puia sp.]